MSQVLFPTYEGAARFVSPMGEGSVGAQVTTAQVPVPTCEVVARFVIPGVLDLGCLVQVHGLTCKNMPLVVRGREQ